MIITLLSDCICLPCEGHSRQASAVETVLPDGLDRSIGVVIYRTAKRKEELTIVPQVMVIYRTAKRKEELTIVPQVIKYMSLYEHLKPLLDVTI